MTDTDREKLLARIKALFSKTTKSGATEAERHAAAEKARELIEKYQLDMGAEELKKEGFVKKNIGMDAARFTCSYARARGVVATTIRPSLNSSFAIGNALEALDDEPNDE